jgi:MoaA/NifB/PqqE/SkfB family radical SAM enzyme
MIRIVNWLLTRRCNLKCDYCAIVKNYEGKPEEYPDMRHYFKNEMTTSDVISGLKKFKKHNPDIFHIFYGGEPMLRNDLPDIINYCNKEDLHYTIISNNTPLVQSMIMRLMDKTDKIKGFTASIDPVLSSERTNLDRVIKSQEGFESLLQMKKYVDDVVAEITVMKENEEFLYKLVDFLSHQGINSDITFIDIAKSPYYDFSNITDENLLVGQSDELQNQMLRLIESDLDIHMKETLLPEIWSILPSNMDCHIDRSLHNVSVDADGSIRLCLRIRGIFAPKIVNLQNLLMPNGEINPIAHGAIKRDKIELSTYESNN